MHRCVGACIGLCRTIIGLYVAICIKPESDMAETCFELQISNDAICKGCHYYL